MEVLSKEHRCCVLHLIQFGWSVWLQSFTSITVRQALALPVLQPYNRLERQHTRASVGIGFHES